MPCARPLTTVLAALCLAAALTGCGTLVRRSELRPALHPLLERPEPGEPRTAADVRPAEVGTDADGELAAQRRHLVLRTLARLEGAAEIDGAPAGDAALVRATFGELRLDAAPERAPHAGPLYRRARPRTGPPRPADLVFFTGDRYPARVGVVRRVLAGGVVEASFVTRGAVRTIRLQPERPHVRRDRGGIVNTFIRPRRPDDPGGTAHLAGQLFAGYRTLLD